MALNTITPSNREEEYLSAIAGDEGASAPVPSNRREEWLRRIAESQGDQTERLDHIEEQIPVDPISADVGKVMTVIADESGETPVYKWAPGEVQGVKTVIPYNAVNLGTWAPGSGGNAYRLRANGGAAISLVAVNDNDEFFDFNFWDSFESTNDAAKYATDHYKLTLNAFTVLPATVSKSSERCRIEFRSDFPGVALNGSDVLTPTCIEVQATFDIYPSAASNMMSAEYLCADTTLHFTNASKPTKNEVQMVKI